jgi:hypothetical protein
MRKTLGDLQSMVQTTTENQATQVLPLIQKVLEVTDVDLEVLKTSPPRLQVIVKGTVPSAGWKNPQLISYLYLIAPPDGIYEFDFVAMPPPDVTEQVMTPIQLVTELPVQEVKGLRVYASLNECGFIE